MMSAMNNNSKLLSGSTLKMIALITMTLDHIGAFLINGTTVGYTILYTWMGQGITLYTFLRGIGRIAFPLYCFLLVEGMMHTHDRKKYGISLLLSALISEIPYDLAHRTANEIAAGYYFNIASQNVFFTLFLGYAACCLLDHFKQKNSALQVVVIIAGYFLASFLNADYGTTGYLLILIMYYLKEIRILQSGAGAALMYYYYHWISYLIPFVLMFFYNGKRGFIRGKWKYVFYAWYPLHLAVIAYLRIVVFA